MKESVCRGCDKPIVWGVDVNGAKIPLDPRAQVYAPRGIPPEQGLIPVMRLNSDEGMVTHFATCREAKKFSGRNKDNGKPKEKEPEPEVCKCYTTPPKIDDPSVTLLQLEPHPVCARCRKSLSLQLQAH